MKLTNYMRDAFINAVMHDVPSGADYAEEARNIVVEDALAQAPAQIRPIWAKGGVAREFLCTASVHYCGTSILVPAKSSHRNDFKLTGEAQHKIDRLEAAAKAERVKRDALRGNLRAVAYSVTTRKALAEALPEFEKYLPADDAKALRSLPVVANVVADFVKAGWPKVGRAQG